MILLITYFLKCEENRYCSISLKLLRSAKNENFSYIPVIKCACISRWSLKRSRRQTSQMNQSWCKYKVKRQRVLVLQFSAKKQFGLLNSYFLHGSLMSSLYFDVIYVDYRYILIYRNYSYNQNTNFTSSTDLCKDGPQISKQIVVTIAKFMCMENWLFLL